MLSASLFPPMNWLPHRYPFVLVDAITALDENSIRGHKCISHSDPFLQGHFPGFPVMPGVLILEALAQLAGIHAVKTIFGQSDEELLMLTGIEKARFKKAAQPGDALLLEANLLARKSGMVKFSCSACLGDDIACTTTLSLFRAPKAHRG